MDKELEKISALYDGELTPKEMRETLKNLEGDFGARSQIKNKDYVTVNTDIGTSLDIDTKEEFNKQKNYKL